ncbi:DoxX family protein [Pedobacter immunditicola]|uniref:DoxX family protein n=1 Tax=Pedobacter immunditicola TaxID=3133440 RepID=UPI0030A424EC
MIQKLIQIDNAGATIIIRTMVGFVFLSEGIQKFLFAGKLGAGRFSKIGLSNPEFLGPFVGSFEIACGILVLIGLLTRISALPLLIIMLVAMATTKTQLYIDKGFWSMLHDSRTDWAMFLGSIFLIVKGGGRWSLDKSLWKQNNSH